MRNAARVIGGETSRMEFTGLLVVQLAGDVSEIGNTVVCGEDDEADGAKANGEADGAKVLTLALIG